MDPKITYLIIGLVVGAGIGFFAINYQITDLRGKLSDSQMQYISLYSQYQLLGNQKNDLQNSYNSLDQQKQIIAANYSTLQSSYAQLKSNSQLASKYFIQLSMNLTSLQNTLQSYCFLQKSFARTLNDSEIRKVGAKVTQLLPNEPNYLAAYDRINTWLTGRITSTNDVIFPYIETTLIDYNGTKVNSGFKILEREEYLKTPEYTLTSLQGDSENQAVLEYAMMKYYDHYIKSTLNSAYLAVLSFSDGSIHSAIFCPSSGGQVCIFDPSGVYVTRDLGIAAPKIAAAELGSYYNYWLSKGQTITNYTLYNIDTSNGTYQIKFNGTLSNLVAFFSS
jgi:hypothetical protein